MSWLLSNNRLEEVCGTLTKSTFSSRLLLSNQDKGCTPSVAHSLPFPLPPGFLLNLSNVLKLKVHNLICLCLGVYATYLDPGDARKTGLFQGQHCSEQETGNKKQFYVTHLKGNWTIL